jgi:hypothetical protein
MDISNPTRRRFLVSELKCYLCGRSCGSIETEQAQPTRPVPDTTWQRLRCERCGGTLYIDDSELVTRYFDNVLWKDERGRPGRPRRPTSVESD